MKIYLLLLSLSLILSACISHKEQCNRRKEIDKKDPSYKYRKGSITIPDHTTIDFTVRTEYQCSEEEEEILKEKCTLYDKATLTKRVIQSCVEPLKKHLCTHKYYILIKDFRSGTSYKLYIDNLQYFTHDHFSPESLGG